MDSCRQAGIEAPWNEHRQVCEEAPSGFPHGNRDEPANSNNERNGSELISPPFAPSAGAAQPSPRLCILWVVGRLLGLHSPSSQATIEGKP